MDACRKKKLRKRVKSCLRYAIFDPPPEGRPWRLHSRRYSSRKRFATAKEAATFYVNKFHHPDWWVRSNVCKSEVSRMKIFGIRLSMRHKSEWIDGTVIAYLPASKQHIVRFDNGNECAHYLTTQKDWHRIPWPCNVLDNSEMGETSTTESYIAFGPDCPRCAAYLGVGANAWSKCAMCGLTFPGACLWNMSK